MSLKEQLKPNEGGTLADAFGRFAVTGHFGWSDGRKLLHFLGEGEWEGPVKLYWRGYELNLADPAVVQFTPGALSDSPTDPVQPIHAFFPLTIPYSGTAVVSVDVPTGAPDVDDTPENLKGIFETRLLEDYDEDGEVVGRSYSQNHARVAAFLILKNSKLATSRIHWAEWLAFRDWCSVNLTWTDLAGTEHTTPRFRANMAFVAPTSVAEAVEFLQLTSCSIIVDDGERFRFLYPGDGREPVHAFTAWDNVLTYKVWRADRRERPVYLRARYRDLQTELLEETTWLVVDERELAIADTVSQPAEIRLGSCDDSQAGRVLRFQLGLKSRLGLFVEIRALGDSFHLIPGDLVTVNIPQEKIEGKTFIVIEATDESPETTAGERTFKLQEWDESIYSDAFAAPNDGVSTRTPPTGLTATVAGTAITLNWTRDSATNTAVQVWVNGGLIATLGDDVETYVHNVIYNGSYSCQVRNMYPTGASAFAGPVAAAVTLGQTEPGSGGGGGGGGGGYGGGGWDGRYWDGLFDGNVN